MKKILLIVPIVFLVICSKCFALQISTHEAINEFDAPIINTQLVNIGFQKGVLDTVNGLPIYKWISLGGHYEDAPPGAWPYTRSFNHFHNPINDSGLTFMGMSLGKSAVSWATQAVGQQNRDGNYSWADVRGYYLQALTSPL